MMETKWLISYGAIRNATSRLYCFPYAGGGASAFRDWSALLPQGIELCAVQLPGRENRLREPALVSLAPIISALAMEIAKRDDLPFAFFGHSLGAVIGFELVRNLRDNYALQPTHLFVSGSRAPQITRDEPRYRVQSDADIVETLRSLNGTPEAVLENAELMQVLLPSLRADFTVASSYRYTPGKPLACPISAYGGEYDPGVTPYGLALWRQQTTSTFAMHLFPGDHFYLQSYRTDLLGHLSRELQSGL